MPHPVGLPDIFVDRSLGRIAVPEAFRVEGLRLTTLAERYGIPNDETIGDETWISDAGHRGEVVFMKDERIRYNRLEKDTLIQHRVRAFCLANKNLPGDEMAARFLRNLASITAACQQPGPFLYAVHASGIRRLPL